MRSLWGSWPFLDDDSMMMTAGKNNSVSVYCVPGSERELQDAESYRVSGMRRRFTLQSTFRSVVYGVHLIDGRAHAFTRHQYTIYTLAERYQVFVHRACVARFFNSVVICSTSYFVRPLSLLTTILSPLVGIFSLTISHRDEPLKAYRPNYCKPMKMLRLLRHRDDEVAVPRLFEKKYLRMPRDQI